MTSKPENLDHAPHLVDVQKFLNIVDIICAKPGMYIGRTGFLGLVSFLEGYIVGVSDNRGTKNHPFGNLLTLLEHTNGFSHPAWGTTRLATAASKSRYANMLSLLCVPAVRVSTRGICKVQQGAL